MSHSYKKVAVAKDNDGPGKKKSWKKIFNRRIRRQKLDIPDGNAYKKFNESWNICDYAFLIEENREDAYKYKTK